MTINKKEIEENIKMYGEATIYLFDGEGLETYQKEAAEYMFNSNNCRKAIIFEDYSVYQDIKTKIWFGNFEDEAKNLMWSSNNELIDDIRFNYNYGENHNYSDEENVDAEMRQIFKQIRSKY